MNDQGKFLLDTHTWIWLANKDVRLGKAARASINSAASSGVVLIAAISIWEIAMLEKAGRINVLRSIHQWVQEALAMPGVVLVPLTPEISIESCNLPGDFHGDPADRMIVATARIEGATLVTKDKRILAYAKQSHVRASCP